MFVPDIRTIKTQYSGGSDDMGSLTDDGSVARFGLDVLWVPVSFRIHFSAGTGTADCTVNLDSARSSAFDAELWRFRDVGTGADVNFSLVPGDYEAWHIEPFDRIVLLWTNPDAGTMLWGIEAKVAPVNA